MKRRYNPKVPRRHNEFSVRIRHPSQEPPGFVANRDYSGVISSQTRSVRVASAGQPMDLVLRVPRQSEEAEFLRAHRATSPTARHFLHYYEEGMPFRRYLEVLAE